MIVAAVAPMYSVQQEMHRPTSSTQESLLLRRFREHLRNLLPVNELRTMVDFQTGNHQPEIAWQQVSERVTRALYAAKWLTLDYKNGSQGLHSGKWRRGSLVNRQFQ